MQIGLKVKRSCVIYHSRNIASCRICRAANYMRVVSSGAIEIQVPRVVLRTDFKVSTELRNYFIEGKFTVDESVIPRSRIAEGFYCT